MTPLRQTVSQVTALLLFILATAVAASSAQQSASAPPASKYEDLAVEQTARRLIRRVDPIHPEHAKSQTGVVLVGFFIDSDGKPIHVQALTGPPVFHKAAIAAVSRWRYRVPVTGVTTVARAYVRFEGQSEQLQSYREYDRVFQAGERAFSARNFSEAAFNFSRALELAETFPDEMNQATLQTMSYLTMSLVHLDRFDDAENLGLRILDFVETKPVASPEMPGIAIIYVVATYMRTMRFEKAEAFLDRTSGFIESGAQEKVHPRARAFRLQTQCTLLLQRAALLTLRKEFDKAEETYGKAAALLPETPAPAALTEMFRPLINRLQMTGRGTLAIRMQEWLTEVRVNAVQKKPIPAPPELAVNNGGQPD